MEEDKIDSTPQQGQKSPLESLSKEEIIQKYKGLLAIAKKAKQAKDDILEENRSLKEQLQQHETQKEADKKALMTMKEMLEAYTENKLQLTTQVAEMQKQRKSDLETLERLSIENESLKRQQERQAEDNESLLRDIENMEQQLKQMSALSKDQKHKIASLEKEIGELSKAKMENHEIKLKNNELSRELQELKEKYKFVKTTNTEQRHKFNTLKERFIEVHKKLKKLKECKKILLETQHEYADAVSQWQNEIIKASNILCKELNDLREENIKLLQKLSKNQSDETIENRNSTVFVYKLNELLELSEKAKIDYHNLLQENTKLKQNQSIKTNKSSLLSLEISSKVLDELWQLSETAFQEYNTIHKENIMLKNQSASEDQFDSSTQACKLERLEASVSTTCEDHKKECKTFEANIKHLKNEKLRNECNQIEKKNNILSTQISELENIKLENSPQNYCQQLLENSSSLKQEISTEETLYENVSPEENLYLKDKVKELENIADAPETIINLKAQLLTTQQLLDEYRHKYKNKEIEHRELLDEMRELNEALKARGDLISRQQEEYQILKTELKTNSERLSKIQQDLYNKDVQINEKQNELEAITIEIAMTKQKFESLENMNSLNEEKIRVLNNELDNIKTNLSVSIPDFDNQSDILSTSTISKADELQRLKDVEDSFEDKYNKLRGLAAKLKKKLQEETIQKQRLEKEIQDLKKQEKGLNTQIVELKNKISDLDLLQKQLNEKQKHIDALKTENQKLKSSRKQANVLNLEIEAAEKSLTEVSNKLANRTSELEAAQESLKSKDSTITRLRKEIELLESSKSSEIKHSQELKQQIDHLHKTLKDEMHNKQQAYDKSKILEQDVENLKLELDNVKVEFAQSTSKQESILKSLNQEREQLFLQLSAAQAGLLDCEQKLKQAERAYEDLRVEYLDYKVKAQAVLRQNHNRDSSKERELEEELLAMKATETRLSTTIQTLTLKIESLEKQKDILNDDNMSLQKRCNELMSLIEDIRTQNDVLNQDVQQHNQQLHETLKQHRQQIESIESCHKEHIQSLIASHQKQMEELRKEISQQFRLPTTVGATKTSILPHQANFDYCVDQGKLDFLLTEREDAEGSEEAAETLANLAASRKISNDSSTTKRSLHDFMPLDELLNTPLNAINSETLITNSQQQQYTTDDSLCTGNSSDLLQLELNSTKERLQKQETRVRHLTAVLAENEQNLAKLTQMNDMLKEELRRQERSVEREQHMHNSEYVKNVIMKFLTLNNADEKTRLVPVLNTILKLNRSEAEMLNCVAKGQKVAETNQRTGGWGNFLSWSNKSNNNN